MRNKRLFVAAICVATLALLAFAGCGSQQQSSSAASKSSSSAPAYSLTIGDAKAGGGEFLLKNDTQKGITQVKVKAAQDADFPAEPLVMSTKTFSTGSIAQVYLPALDAQNVSSGAKAAIQFTCADGTVYTLHDVLIREVKDASLCVEGDVAYLKYTNADNNQPVDTLENEKALLAVAAPAAAVAATSNSGAQEQRADSQPNPSGSNNQGSSENNESSGAGSDSGNSDSANSDSGNSGASAPAETQTPVNDNAVGGGAEADCIEDPVLKN